MLVAGILELVGGLLIVVGFLTRPAAFILSRPDGRGLFHGACADGLLSGQQHGRCGDPVLLRVPLSGGRRPGAWSVDNAGAAAAADRQSPSTSRRRMIDRDRSIKGAITVSCTLVHPDNGPSSSTAAGYDDRTTELACHSPTPAVGGFGLSSSSSCAVSATNGRSAARISTTIGAILLRTASSAYTRSPSPCSSAGDGG